MRRSTPRSCASIGAALALVPALVASIGCSGLGVRSGSDEAVDIFDIGSIHRTISTDSAEAQLWFDRGLAYCFGFNHEAAVEHFERALTIDPSCAMAAWGIAYALGPNYNNTAHEEGAIRGALAALERARAALDDETAAERALITALATRFATPGTSDRATLDRAYAEAMRTVRARFPDDPEVNALTAEAVMQLNPWKLWSPAGEMAAETPEIRSILEPALTRWPDHPALCHLYIHTMEAGPEVAKALPAARRLEGIAPGLGHLVHMPSHIYVWTGNYADVIETNIAAVRADDAFAAEHGRENFFTAYRIHDLHFVAYGAMWSGQRDLALEFAHRIPEEIPASLRTGFADLFEIFLATPYHVMVRFGMWDELVASPEPPADQPSVVAVWRYARALAFASLGRVEEAEREQERFLVAKAAVPSSRFLFNNEVASILSVAETLLAGEVEYRKGNFDRAFTLLREAVRLDDQLNYDEPWGWMEPARHALGALLTEQGRFEEAMAVYARNLERYPENGWALHGLAECAEGLGRMREAKEFRARFEKAFAGADIEIPGSCFCKGVGVAAAP